MRSSTPFEHSGSRDGAVGGGVGIGVAHALQRQSLHDTPVKQERFMCNLLKHCYIHKAGARRGACFVFTSVHFCQLVWASLPSRTNSFSRDPERRCPRQTFNRAPEAFLRRNFSQKVGQFATKCDIFLKGRMARHIPRTHPRAFRFQPIGLRERA